MKLLKKLIAADKKFNKKVSCALLYFFKENLEKQIQLDIKQILRILYMEGVISINMEQ